MYQFLKEFNTEYFRFESQQEQMEEVSKVLTRYPHATGNPLEQVRRASFTGRKFHSWQHVQQAMGEVWVEGMQTYESMMSELQGEHLPAPQSIRRKRRWSEEDGDEVNVDRLMRGQAYWDQSHRDHRPGPLNVTLITDVATSACVNHMDILWRGAAAVLLTELLEKAGYRVEMWAATWCLNSHRNGRGTLIATNYKRSGDPLDVSTLINGISGWSYRIVYFGSYHCSNSEPCNGLGNIQSLRKIQKEITPDEQTILVEDIWSRHAAVDWVKTRLETMFQTQS